MDEKYHSPLVRERLSNYYTVLATTILVFVAIAGVITDAEIEDPAMFVVLIVAVAIYGILAGHAASQDLKVPIKAMDADIKGFVFGDVVSARNMTALSAASAGSVGITGFALVWADISRTARRDANTVTASPKRSLPVAKFAMKAASSVWPWVPVLAISDRIWLRKVSKLIPSSKARF